MVITDGAGLSLSERGPRIERLVEARSTEGRENVCIGNERGEEKRSERSDAFKVKDVCDCDVR